MRDSLHAGTREVSERPGNLSDHVKAVEGNIEHRIENISIGKINKKVIRRCSHPAMSENDPDDDTISTEGQKNNHGKEEEKGDLDHREEDARRDDKKIFTHLYKQRQANVRKFFFGSITRRRLIDQHFVSERTNVERVCDWILDFHLRLDMLDVYPIFLQ